MNGRVKWVEGMSFVAESGSGHSVVVDASPDLGGRNIGLRPMEMVLLGAAACSALDVVHILKKGRHPIEDCVCEADADRAGEHPQVFKRIHLHFRVAGRELDEKAVARAVELSAEKYCSATAMLSKTADVTHDFEILTV